MSNEFRLADGGHIDRDRPIDFHFDGQPLSGYAGDTLASALLANGVHRVGPSVKYRRPRGIVSAGVEEPNALVQVDEPHAEPMLTATTVPLEEGLRARSVPGRGQLVDADDSDRHDTMHTHCDVLVVGGGPAGLAVADAAASSGARVILADSDARFGGTLLGRQENIDGLDASCWIDRTTRYLEDQNEVRLLHRTTVFGYYDNNYLMAVEQRAGGSQRIWRIRAKEVVLATGSHERPIVFAGNDRPGIMLAGAAETYLHRYAVLPGRRAVLFTTNDSGYAAAVNLYDAGVDVAAVVDAREVVSTHWASLCIERGIPIHSHAAVVSTSGPSRVTHAHLSTLEADNDRYPGVHKVVTCDLLLVSGGWTPAVHLHSQAGGRLRHDESVGAFLPDGARQRVRSAGACAGTFTTSDCLRYGAQAGSDASIALGFVPEPQVRPTADRVPVLAGTNLAFVPSSSDVEGTTQFVDLTRDATVADIRRATGAGLTSVEHVKRYTTIGTGHEQGKTSGILSTGVIAALNGQHPADLGTTSFRAPFTPVSFAALAGRERGDLYDPIRVTALHDWHVEQGAPFENVGQWKRPWYYPRFGEDMENAVLRECRAAREGVAIQDVSTLGKIDVQGPDAAEFLDRVYTNKISTLKPGRIRYAVMCGSDGMVFDDGTVLCASEGHYLLTTTTGGAAGVLDWLEDWLQTEWTDLRVHLTSVTEQWATIALVGPQARDVLGRVSGIDLDNDLFPFMSWVDGLVAGRRARVCRISFSGELAYEINVPWWHGRELWETLVDAGRPESITPYGTETMHVLRAEKGFPIVGQDTDGTVTPYDLGMNWAVSKSKHDFLGKRSFDREDTRRQDRKHLVGILPQDPGLVLSEGAQLVDTRDLPEPPVPMLGHVTSSYRSATLDRGFALALVHNGHNRHGDTIYSPLGDELVPVTVTDTVFYDKQGARRDG